MNEHRGFERFGSKHGRTHGLFLLLSCCLSWWSQMLPSHFQIYTAEQNFVHTFSFLLTRTKIKDCDAIFDCDQNRLLWYSKLVHRSISTYTEGEWRWCIRCGMEDGSFKCPMEKPVYFSLHSTNLQILNQKKQKAVAFKQLIKPERNCRQRYDMELVLSLAWFILYKGVLISSMFAIENWEGKLKMQMIRLAVGKTCETINV